MLKRDRNAAPKSSRTHLRGLILTEQALKLLDQELGKWWESSIDKQASKTGKLSREEKARRLGISINTLDKIYRREPTDEVTLRYVFDQLKIVPRFSKELHCVSSSPPSDNLPRFSTPCIGRESEIREIKTQLESYALVTLIGAGGVGKTRLAVQAAAEMKSGYAGGVCFVALAGTTDPERVVQEVAAALGVRQENERPLLKTLSRFVREKSLLLLLDNCEHLLPACASLTETLLSASAYLKILATSRERLNIRAEQPLRVPSLAVPDTQDLPQTPEHIASFLRDYEAVRLFVERARVHRPDFAVTTQNASLLALICRRLDGIPLALELAAARVRALSLNDLIRELDDCFSLLTGGNRAALPRYQTLQAAMDWSYDLLTEQERTMLRRLSVFADGWQRDAAAQVCIGDNIEARDILDLLTSLVDKSLVAFKERDGAARYTLLETVRQYGRGHLARNGEENALQKRHSAYFLSLAEEAEPHLASGEQQTWLARLDGEQANLNAALEWSLSEADAAAGLRLCGALGRFWYIRGHLSEGRNWCRQALEKSDGGTHAGERAKALFTAGGLAFQQGDYGDARSSLEASLALYQQIGDKNGMARALNTLASVVTNQEDCDTARTFYEQSRTLCEETGNRLEMTRALNGLGGLAADFTDYASARSYLEESLSIFRELENQSGVANVLKNLGFTAHLQSDFIAAHRFFRKSRAVCNRIGDHSVLPYVLYGLGLVAFSQGAYEAARSWYEQEDALCREIGDRSGQVYACTGLANVAEAQGDYSAAWEFHIENLLLYRDMGNQWGVVTSFRDLAELAVKVNKREQAAVLWGITEALFNKYGPFTPREQESCERAIIQARQALDTTDLRDVWQRGAAMSSEEAIEYALEECD